MKLLNRLGFLGVFLASAPAWTGAAEGLRPDTVLLDKTGRGGDGMTNMVSVSIDGDKRVIRANGWPDHKPGQFPNRGNPNSLSSQNLVFRVPLKPQASDRTSSGQGAWFGVAVNGVPFEPGTAEFWNGDPRWNYEAKSGFINLGLDLHNAHVQPTGAYHYHGTPTGLVERLGGDTKKMLMLGWAADGFPIYTVKGYSDPMDTNSPLKSLRSSYQLKKGERLDGPGGRYDGRFTADYEYVKGSGDLDECNGRYGATPEFPQGIYHYHVTEEFPQLSRLWRGTADESFQKHMPGGAGRFGPPGRGKGKGPPPPGFGPPPGRGPRPPPGAGIELAPAKLESLAAGGSKNRLLLDAPGGYAVYGSNIEPTPMSTSKTDATIPTNMVASRKSREVRPHSLKQVDGEGAPQRVTLNKPNLVIGRAEDADIRLPSKRASRQHAFLKREGADYAIQDNDSRNGVYLNGLKIHSAILRDGDVVQVADGVFTYHEG
jgi:hypothetical protein